LREEAGGKAAGLSVDLYTEPGVAKAGDYCRDVFGGAPDIAISNVYGTDRYTFESATTDLFLEGYQQIVMSAVHLARAVLPSMKERGWGRVVTIGSFCAKKPHWHIPLVVDNVTRAAAVALSKSLSNEYSAFGITVNTVAPGFIATDMAQVWMQTLAREQGKDVAEEENARNALIPAGRSGTPEEIAAACVFLCSAPASYISGQLIMVDGGLVGAVF
jgi:3-oxoacyl-[acyl-carrier protein] reductase